MNVWIAVRLMAAILSICSTPVEFDGYHLTDSQQAALEIIAHNRTWCDYTEAGACGIAHFAPCPGILSADEQVSLWQRRVGRAESVAVRHQWEGDEAVLAMLVANSDGVSGFETMADSCKWNVECVTASYSTTRHRRLRILRWRWSS